MSTLSRQNSLFISEDWLRIYEALHNVDFRAYDLDNLVEALMTYLRVNYADEFNDWISSSEFVRKIEILAWLSQNIAFRVDLNTRENFLATAERRDSLIRLAQNIAYKINRVRGASGLVRLTRIRSNQPIVDSNNISLQDRQVIWNDPKNEDWYEQFVLIMNAAFATRTKYGRPISQYLTGSYRTDQYVFNSLAPTTGTFSFSSDVNGATLPFDLFNGNMSRSNGEITEIPPRERNSFSIFFKQDGKGFGSLGTGFYLPVKQGRLRFQDFDFSNPLVLRTQEVLTNNINNDDFFVQRLDANGNFLEDWTKVDTIFGEGVAFNTLAEARIYELSTLVDDRVLVRFGDGSFGKIPVGRFRFWYRTSNASPIIVKTDAIQNKTVTIPYVSNDTIYYLSLSYSLPESLVNAAASETNLDIRTRANRVFYSQNRMITGQDYNNFFLRDNAIRKIKTINRTYAGHSRFTKLHDPTGLYENVKILGGDGRFYQDDTLTVNTVSADIDILPTDILVNRYVRPIIRKEDKRLLYYNRYPEFFIRNDGYTWSESAIVGGKSRGNVIKRQVAQPVGAGQPNFLQYINTDAIIRYADLNGPVVRVDRVVDDGTAASGIFLHDYIPNGANLISVFPAIRDRFTQPEVIELEKALNFRIDFGLSWDQPSESWDLVRFSDLDKEGKFSLTNRGDESNSHLDASWLIYFEFVADGENGNLWRIVDRGLGIFFERAREVDFYFANSEPVVDPETGRSVQDEIRLLACNESRDSLRRRGLDVLTQQPCSGASFTYLGDGVRTCFKTSVHPILPETNIVILGVLQIIGVDYTIQIDVTGDRICFTIPPDPGTVVEIKPQSGLLNAKLSVKTFLGTGLQEQFDLGEKYVVAQNLFAFIDGVVQNSLTDMNIGRYNDSSHVFFNQPLPADTEATAYFLSGIDSACFQKLNYTGDGVIGNYHLPTRNQTIDTLIVKVDGVLQVPYRDFVWAPSSDDLGTDLTFTTVPPLGVRLQICTTRNVNHVRARMFVFTTDGITNSYPLDGLGQITAKNLIVALDGIQQEGSYSTRGVWRVTGLSTLFFAVPPPEGLTLMIWALLGAVGTLNNPDDGDTTIVIADNLGDITTKSCGVNYQGEDLSLHVEDALRHDDGYVNANGLFVKPADSDRSGFYEHPYLFKQLVLMDGFTDLVLWRQIEEFGFTIWDPINQQTVPKATYGLSTQGKPVAEAELELNVVHGSIHYDIFTDQWLVANIITGVWELADQTKYRWKIGRDHLKFQWNHYSPEAHRIDPSISNIMDAYVLTSSYDDTYRSWLITNGDINDEPLPPSPESLRVQFGRFSAYKAQSDSVIYHAARYKLLFGSLAVPEVQATFKLIQTKGRTISANDLKLRTLNVITDYFSVARWDFGEKFYFTELCAFIHVALAPDVQTVVIVPKNTDQAFGRLFQVRCEPDELFLRSAGPLDVEIVDSLTDAEIRIGSFVL